MKTVIADLVDYVEKQTISSLIAPTVETLGRREVRVVAIKLLGWLRVRAHKTRHTSLTFNENYPWCQNLLVLLSEIPSLKELFEVKENVVDFRDTVATDEIIEIQSYVNTHHPPNLRVTWAR